MTSSRWPTARSPRSSPTTVTSSSSPTLTPPPWTPQRRARTSPSRLAEARRTSMADPVVVQAELLRGWPLPRGDDKESRGRVVVAGGSDRTPGGVLLAAEAALRAGAGKVQVITTDGVSAPCAVALPEALVTGAPTDDGTLDAAAAELVAEFARKADCLLVGPGLDDVDAAARLAGELLHRLQDWDGVLVLDALALAYVSQERSALPSDPLRVVLT